MTEREERAMRARIGEMKASLSRGRSEVQPSKYWDHLNTVHEERLFKYGYENFKIPVASHYFTWLPNFPVNRQTRYLVSHSGPGATIRNIFRSFFPPRHRYLRWRQSLFYNFLVFMLWEYARRNDNEDLLGRLEEPEAGNPPRIHLDGRLISQDIANSAIEFNSMMGPVRDREKIGTVCELGAGYGRTAFVFLSVMSPLKYIIIDTPPALYIAERYLSGSFPGKRIFAFREFNSYSDIKEEFERSDILFFLPSQIEMLPEGTVDLFISISTLHEMRPGQIRYYFTQIERLLKKGMYFYLKAAKDSRIPYEDIHIREEDYPVPEDWVKVFWREAKVQTDFFEALLRSR
ncbi:MAG: putative sugar O-methyltransferase [Candidatus Omnitrophota bacterium]